MNESLLAFGWAFWLGVLTSISPCPLTSNIAAISFIGRKLHEPRRVFTAGLLYTAGRTFTYVVLGGLLLSSVLSVIDVSSFLQGTVYRLLGPLLVLVGMLVLGLFKINVQPPEWINKLGQRAVEHGAWGAFVLGALFALAFCPVSAALFFASLMPLADKADAGLAMPALYGLGTALPVCIFAALVASGARWIGAALSKLSDFEKWARWTTGVVFILAGIVESLRSIFGLL